MGYVALKRLKWGDGFIEPGEPVPEGEEGRDYASLLYHGQIGPLKDAVEMSDAELAAALEKVTAERDEALAGSDAPVAEVEVPEGVTPGETPGWPIDAVTGKPLALTDEQRADLAEKEILPAGSAEAPVLAIVTHAGELVVIDDGMAEEAETEVPAESDAGEQPEEEQPAEENAGTDEAEKVEIEKPEKAPAKPKRKPAKRKPAKKK